MQIVVSALVGTLATAIVVVAYARWSNWPTRMLDTVLISATVGLSILVWREAGNTPALNDDSIPVVSPNDVLCPVLTYVCLGLLAAFHTTLRRGKVAALTRVAHCGFTRGERRHHLMFNSARAADPIVAD